VGLPDRADRLSAGRGVAAREYDNDRASAVFDRDRADHSGIADLLLLN
jgi:hypothetical protein